MVVEVPEYIGIVACAGSRAGAFPVLSGDGGYGALVAGGGLAGESPVCRFAHDGGASGGVINMPSSLYGARDGVALPGLGKAPAFAGTPGVDGGFGGAGGVETVLSAAPLQSGIHKLEQGPCPRVLRGGVAGRQRKRRTQCAKQYGRPDFHRERVTGP